MMDTRSTTSNNAEPEEPKEPPQRVLLPSKLGTLGVEVVGEIVTQLTILPSRSQRRHFTKLQDLDRSDFFDECFGHLSEFLAGARRNLGIGWSLDDAELDGLSRRVLEEASTIPYGQTRTYQKLASRAGVPDAYRVVRSILMANPLPILIPCHRVTPRKGGVGSWIGGTKKKEWLLKLEQAGLKSF